jgi:hypothetical protein
MTTFFENTSWIGDKSASNHFFNEVVDEIHTKR